MTETLTFGQSVRTHGRPHFEINHELLAKGLPREAAINHLLRSETPGGVLWNHIAVSDSVRIAVYHSPSIPLGEKRALFLDYSNSSQGKGDFSFPIAQKVISYPGTDRKGVIAPIFEHCFEDHTLGILFGGNDIRPAYAAEVLGSLPSNRLWNIVKDFDPSTRMADIVNCEEFGTDAAASLFGTGSSDYISKLIGSPLLSAVKAAQTVANKTLSDAKAALLMAAPGDILPDEKFAAMFVSRTITSGRTARFLTHNTSFERLAATAEAISKICRGTDTGAKRALSRYLWFVFEEVDAPVVNTILSMTPPGYSFGYDLVESIIDAGK